ncbi:YjfB family protein [Vallitalea sp.]|jgi:predicted HicB family RNase H-like nuclease|uniref:YjfB family protein n=1 Tax=Vallitalea sp. TaxID=1882829 RepID=UPI0025EAB23C|nr:YjfB family protein [Vallitalea sp.]MCT4686254.1 YjfB family protein [Vallitalea sp.]
MDIATLSTSLSQGKIMSQVNISLSKMGMDMVKQQGQALNQLIQSASLETSVNPHIGANIDIRL